MASQGAATSRLAQMQMRFQQKQLQVREQRKIEMTASKEIGSEILDNESTVTNKTNAIKNLNATIGNGKVRQMFNERRRGAGIDRSNPLKPITSRSSSSSSTLTTTSISSKNTESTFPRRQDVSTIRNLDKTVSSKTPIQKNQNGDEVVDYNKNGTYLVDDDDLDKETFPEHSIESNGQFEIELPSKLQALALGNGVSHNGDNNNNQTQDARSKLGASIKLNPVLTKKSPPTAVSKPPSRSNLNSTTRIQANSPLGTTHRVTPTKQKAVVKSSQNMAKTLASPTTKPPAAIKNTLSHPPGTVPCKICSRYFNEDRVAKHEEVCQKMAMKKRKIFDASKHRVKGTEAEKYLKKPLRGSKPIVKNTSVISNTSSTDSSSKKSNWRKKHEEFIAAIRAAKEVQAHLAKGGKLSDLPPPPPSENPDYITCPHCSRRFNEAAANRHIPKCANMLHNKPKPAARRR